MRKPDAWMSRHDSSVVTKTTYEGSDAIALYALTPAELAMLENAQAELARVRAETREEAAKVCEALYANHYAHSQRKVGADNCAAAIRGMS